MKLSEHFTLEEAVKSKVAEAHGVINNPPVDILDNMKKCAAKLEVVRNKLGCKLIVNSWFRNFELNKLVGGAKNSAHLTGWAVDLSSNEMSAYDLGSLIISYKLNFDQIIHEYGTWVHISFDPAGRKQILTKFDGPYKNGWLTKEEYNRK